MLSSAPARIIQPACQRGVLIAAVFYCGACSVVKEVKCRKHRCDVAVAGHGAVYTTTRQNAEHTKVIRGR